MSVAASDSPSAPNERRKGQKDFVFGRALGEGSFSTVYLAKEIETGKEYAIKVCEKRHIIREKKQKYITREKEAMLLLSDSINTTAPFFVRLACTFHDTDSLYFVLTLAPKGDLLTYLQKADHFSMEVATFYTAELVHAVEYMHMIGIIHRDLKPENILLSSERHILITDFGSSKILPTPPLPPDTGESCDGTPRRNSFVGTAQYVSPEILTNERPSPASDLWAVGCILFQMLHGSPPFQARSEYAIFQKILKLEFQFPDSFPPLAKDLISKLLVIDCKQRLGAQDFGGYPSIKQHGLFESVNFDALHLKSPPLPNNFSDETDTGGTDQNDFQDAEPGLGNQQLSRILGLHLGDGSSVSIGSSHSAPGQTSSNDQPPNATRIKTVVQFPANDQELQSRLLQQQETMPQWHSLVDKKLVLKHGLIDKRQPSYNLFSRRRMFLLTLGPCLYYFDPTTMVLKGQVPFGATLKVEPKNFKNFLVHTPGRTYHLEDPEGFALEWCKALEEVRKHYYD